MVPADSRRISRVLRYSGVAWISKTGFAYGAVTLCGRASLRVRLPVKSITVGNPTTPGGALPRPRFGLFRFRSPLLAESLLFSLPAGTEMFQFPAFAPRLEARCRDRSRRVSPFGHPRVWRAFAPNRGFSQLVTSFFASESHRHPPCALLCFPFSFRLL